jgi:hypothetical protein
LERSSVGGSHNGSLPQPPSLQAEMSQFPQKQRLGSACSRLFSVPCLLRLMALRLVALIYPPTIHSRQDESNTLCPVGEIVRRWASCRCACKSATWKSGRRPTGRAGKYPAPTRMRLRATFASLAKMTLNQAFGDFAENS